jgi:very-short-patch-repair endonuclease
MEVARRAARQWGVVSVADLRACGLDGDAIAHRCRSGWLHRLHRAVYAVGHLSLSLEGRLLAAVMACGLGAVASHRWAAWLHGLLNPAGWAVEVTVPHDRRVVDPLIRVHRSRHLPSEVTTRRRGIPVTTVPRTLLDLASVLDETALRRAVREAQARKLATVGEIAAILRRPGPRAGRMALARIIATGPAPTRSVLEDTVLDLMLRGGIEHPEVNRPMFINGRRVIPDFRWPGRRLVLEADGAAFHDGKIAREDDAIRQALLEAHGERVIRVTWEQTVVHPEQTLARIRAAGAPLQRAATSPWTKASLSITTGGSTNG